MDRYIIITITSKNKKNIDKIINELFSKHKAVGFEMQRILTIPIEQESKEATYKIKFRTRYSLLKEIKKYIKEINTDKFCKITYNETKDINKEFKNRIDREIRSDNNEQISKNI